MSTRDAGRYFADEWARLTPGLRAALAKAGAPADDRDDLVQETATRLLGVWDQIDWDRGVDSLAYRIALNVWHDQWRHRGRREVLGEVPEPVDPANTERVAMARLEIAEVARALTALPPATARVLRLAAREAEGERPTRPAPAALRMARTRARRALAAVAQVACAVAGAAFMAARAIARPARASIALGALATVALVGSAEAPSTTAPPATWAARPTAVGLPHSSAIAPVRTVARPVASRRHVAAARHARAVKDRTPYYTIDPGPASANVFFNVDLYGYGAEVSKPQPGDSKPVCTYGNSPSLPTVSHCTGR